jgi:hypothetical protein
MKLFKLGLHFWIALTSTVSFITGWILLAHAPKPIQNTNAFLANANTATMPTLEPLAPLSSFNNGGNDVQSQPFLSMRPRTRSNVNPFGFMTGGS